jgi:hypothetical protein
MLAMRHCVQPKQRGAIHLHEIVGEESGKSAKECNLLFVLSKFWAVLGSNQRPTG